MITNKDKSKLARLSLLIIGIVFFAVGLGFALFYINVLDNSVEITGTILYAGDEKTLVGFEIDGKYYEQYLNESSSAYYYGKQITLQYSYDTNRVYSYMAIYLFPLMFGGIGLITLIVYVFWMINVKKRKHFLMNKDKYIKKIAKVVDIKRNNLYSVNNEFPHQLICEVNFNGEKLIVKSPNFWEKLYFEKHYVVDVYFKTKKQYIVDLSSYRKDEIYYEMEEFE